MAGNTGRGGRPRRSGRTGRWAGGLIIVAVIGTTIACSGTDASEGEVGEASDAASRELAPTGDLLGEVEGVGSVFSGTVEDVASAEVEVAESDAGPPAGLGALAVGPGLAVTAPTPATGRYEVHVALPPSPSDDAVPVVIHVDEAGNASVEPGLWDPEANEMVVMAASFSDRFGAWYDPRNWGEEVVQGAQGAWDFAADFVTGRTDPPACPNADNRAAPTWSRMATAELSSLHACAQMNPDDDGSERFELYLASNRRTAQVVSLPDIDRDYVWVENQPDLVNRVLAWASGVDAADNVVLLGEHDMSLGFRRQAMGASFEVRSRLTWQVMARNAVTAILGELPLSGSLAVSVAAYHCVSEFSGIEVTRLDVVPDGFASAQEFLAQLVRCAIAVAEQPELLVGIAREGLDSLGIRGRDAAGILDDLGAQALRIAPVAARIATGLAIVTGGAHLWDLLFDNLAAGSAQVDLVGTLDPAALAASTSCSPRCTHTGTIAADHPTWGPIHIVTFGPALSSDTCSGADVLAVDAAGEVRWARGVHPDDCYYLFAPAGTHEYGSAIDSPVDADGRIFLDYNPGRYNGVVVLDLAEDDIDDHGSMPTPDNYDARFYFATVVDPDGDGTYGIESSYNDCNPSCAGGTTTSYVSEWADGDFVAVPPTSPTPCGAHTVDVQLPDEILDITATGVVCPDAHQLAAEVGAARAPYALNSPELAVGEWHCTISVPEYVELYECTGPGTVTFSRFVGEGD